MRDVRDRDERERDHALQRGWERCSCAGARPDGAQAAADGPPAATRRLRPGWVGRSAGGRCRSNSDGRRHGDGRLAPGSRRVRRATGRRLSAGRWRAAPATVPACSRARTSAPVRRGRRVGPAGRAAPGPAPGRRPGHGSADAKAELVGAGASVTGRGGRANGAIVRRTANQAARRRRHGLTFRCPPSHRHAGHLLHRRARPQNAGRSGTGLRMVLARGGVKSSPGSAREGRISECGGAARSAAPRSAP